MSLKIGNGAGEISDELKLAADKGSREVVGAHQVPASGNQITRGSQCRTSRAARVENSSMLLATAGSGSKTNSGMQRDPIGKQADKEGKPGDDNEGGLAAKVPSDSR